MNLALARLAKLKSVGKVVLPLSANVAPLKSAPFNWALVKTTAVSVASLKFALVRSSPLKLHRVSARPW